MGGASVTAQDYRLALERKKGERDHLAALLERARGEVRTAERAVRNTEQAQAVLRHVAQQTQAELEYQISEVVTLALSAVFPEDPYEFKVEFVQRNGKTEADLLFVREDARVDPLSASGGGAVDVAAFALRVALWSMQRPRGRAVLVLDEPFRFLSRGLQPRAAAFLKVLAARLGLQILMASHSPDLIEEADRVFEVRLGKGGVSEVSHGV